MGRPDPRAPGIGQDALFPTSEPTATDRAGQVLRGRHSDAVDRALAAAHTESIIADVDGAAATLLRAGAWALDAFEASGKPYGPAKLIPALNETLRELHMTPESRTDADPTSAAIVALLDDMAQLEGGEVDADGVPPVHHTAE